MNKIDLLPYDSITTSILNEYHKKVSELPPPPKGYHYNLSEPQFKFANNQWEVTNYIILEEDGR